MNAVARAQLTVQMLINILVTKTHYPPTVLLKFRYKIKDHVVIVLFAISLGVHMLTCYNTRKTVPGQDQLQYMGDPVKQLANVRYVK